MNYDHPNKVDALPGQPGTGSMWTAEEHNDMKAAVNSKMDAANMVQDLNTPSNLTYPSTSAIATAMGVNSENFKYRGEILPTTNISALTLPGYYSIGVASGIGILDPSFPDVAAYYERGGQLLVFSDSFQTKHILSLNQVNSSFPERLFTNYRILSGPFEGWREFASLDYLTTNFIPQTPQGHPTITAISGINLSTDTADLNGFISFVNNTGAALPAGINIIIQFQYPRDGLKSIQITSLIGESAGPIASPYSTPSNSQAIIRLREGVPNGSGGSFFYHIS